MQVTHRLYGQPANKDAIIAAVGQEPQHITQELGLSQLRVLEELHDDQSHPYQYLWSMNLFPDDSPTDAILQMAISTHCR